MTAEPGRYYLDTSAWLAMVLGEPQAPALAAELRGGLWLSSALFALEAHRNIVRLARSGDLDVAGARAATDRLDRDLTAFVLRDLDLELALVRTFPPVATPRSLDLVHLRTALWFHAQEPLTRFVTLDRALQDAAADMGLPVARVAAP